MEETPRKNNNSKGKKYTPDDMKRAVTAVLHGGMSRNQASIQFKIPKTTLQKKVIDAGSADYRKVPRLGYELEQKLVAKLCDKLDRGMKLSHFYIANAAIKLIESYGLKVQRYFPNGSPGQKWVKLFIGRHSELERKMKIVRSSNLQKVSTVDTIKPESLPMNDEIQPQIASDQEHVFNDRIQIAWCGQQQSDSSYFGAESLVECELRPPQSPQQYTTNTFRAVKTLLRSPVKNFIGRDMEHRQMVSLIQSRPEGRLFSAVVTGPPGIGKTELILRVVTSMQSFHHVLWLRGDALAGSVERMASLLGCGANMKEVFSACSPHATLVLYDNIIDPEQVQDYLPPLDSASSNNVVILITSQYTNWECDFHVSLQPLEHYQGVQFLLESLDNVPTDIAEEVSLRLNHLPLALQLVISYKKQLQSLEDKPEAIKPSEDDPYAFLHYKLGETEREGYSKTLFEVFNQALQIIDDSELGKLALNILNLIAFMDPLTSNISKGLINYIKKDIGVDVVDNILDMLQKYSLLQSDGEQILMFRIYKAILRAKCHNINDIESQLMRYRNRS